MHVACDEGKAECLSILINAGAELNRPNAEDQTPVWLATQSGEVDCLELLVCAQADLRAGITEPIQVARETQQAEVAATLALATLDFNPIASERDWASRWLHPTDQKPLVGMLTGVGLKELTATVTGESLVTCLPYAFSHFPLDTALATIDLVLAYRDRERETTQLDQRAGASLLDAAYKAQQILVQIVHLSRLHRW